MHQNYIQLPPDGVGKQVAATKTYIVPIANSTSGFYLDQPIRNSTGSIKLYVKQINTYSKILYCMYQSTLNEGAQLSLNDALYDISTDVQIGLVSSTTLPYFMYVNMTTSVSYDNPYHGQKIDEQGQSLIRYSEGSQMIDGSGQSKFTEEFPIGAYRTSNIIKTTHDFTKIIVGTSDLVNNTQQECVTLTTGTTSGDSIKIVSNKYHYRAVGNSSKIEMLIKIGDTGSLNVVRRWGYFDGENGYFFELDGSSLYAVKRTNASDL
jgi:hypothetical protein